MIGKHVKLFLALSFAKGIGNRTLVSYAKSKINSDFGLSYEQAIKNSSISKIKKITASAWQKCLAKAETEIEHAKVLKINLISYPDKEYPFNLRFLPDAPSVLYVQGDYQILNNDKIVAVIGTRMPSPAGTKIDTTFSTILSNDGFVTVAGLAQGCDTYAHRATVKAKGKTVAIMGASLDQPIYPKENTDLAAEIVKSGGALVSSFHFGTKISRYNFSIRDEWQCGVSDGVLAIETAVKGGTRIAMHHATVEKRPLAVIDYRQSDDKELLALPTFQGNLDSLKNENALPLFSKKSLSAFEQRLIESRKQRLGQLKD